LSLGSVEFREIHRSSGEAMRDEELFSFVASFGRHGGQGAREAR